MKIQLEECKPDCDEFIEHLGLRLGEETRKERIMHILSSVLHILRQKLTTEESNHLIAQLPLALKELYCTGLESNQEKHHPKTIGQFAAELVEFEREAINGVFFGREEVFIAIRAFIQTLTDYKASEEVEEMVRRMPADFKQVMEPWMLRYH